MVYNIHSLTSQAIKTPFYNEMIVMTLNIAIKKTRVYRTPGQTLGFSFIQMLSVGRNDETIQTVAERKNTPRIHQRSRFLMHAWCYMNVIKSEKHRRAHQGAVKRANYTNCKSRVESGLMQVLSETFLTIKEWPKDDSCPVRCVWNFSFIMTTLCFSAYSPKILLSVPEKFSDLARKT